MKEKKQQQQTKAFEYMRIAGNNLEILNQYGRNGWEVIALEGREVLLKREIELPLLDRI